MPKTKLMIAVETETSYEIFDNILEAISFAKKEKVKNAFVADFNTDRLFKEKNGEWNYEDFADTYNGRKDIELNSKL